MTTDTKPMTLMFCGPKLLCVDDAAHDYSIRVPVDNGETMACARCGHHAIDDAYWDD